jgi:hypothetical protein
MKIRTSLLLLLISITQITTFAQDADWETPIGIPVPPFGINESYRMYDDAVKRAASGLTYQASSGGGYFTHYVDANDPASTDSSNTYGSIAKPRKTIPSSLPAGSIVEIHNRATYASQYTLMSGTEALPIFIRGVGSPLITNKVTTKGQYTIIEGLYMYKTGINVNAHNGICPSYICIRNCEIKGDGTFGNTGTGIAMSGITTPKTIANNIVVYNNEISYLGKWNSDVQDDMHGVKPDKYCQYVWIIGNHLHHLGGDSVQIGNVGAADLSYFYIGNNVMHDNHEDGVDIKNCSNVIVSQNEMYNMATGGGAFGHYDANNLWFLFNRMHDSRDAISGSSNSHYGFIGNIVYNLTRLDRGPIFGTGAPMYVIGNIIYNCPLGIELPVREGYPAIICNNIVMKTTNPVDGENYHLEVYNTEADNSIATNNLFYQPGGTVRIKWKNTYSTIASWQAATGKGTGTVEDDPLFVDPDNGDFNLKEGSPVNNLQTSSQAQAVYETFMQLYGVDLAADIAGKERTLYVPHSVPDNTDTGSTDSGSEDILPDNSVDTGSTQETQDSTPVVTDTAEQVPQSSGSENSIAPTNNTSDTSNASDTSQAANTSPETATSQTTGTAQITGTIQVSSSGTQDNSDSSTMTGFITTKITPRKIFGRYDDIYNTAKRGWTVKKEYFE